MAVWAKIKAASAAAVGVKACLGRELLGMVEGDSQMIEARHRASSKHLRH